MTAPPASIAPGGDLRGSPSRFQYRPELDGLRAIAVSAVLVYHLDSSWLPGGFLGVDIFFVISGYLITRLLISEHARTGGIALAAFWARRARRLLPALLLMLTGVAIYWTVATDDLEQVGLRGDLTSALFYVSNWRFIASGESYFEQFVSVSPVRHAWSLSIEEQFYILWPLIAAACLRVGRLRGLSTATTIGALASASILWFLFDPDNVSRAYYDSFGRVHEIFVGVGLAIVLESRHGARALRTARWLGAPSAICLVACLALMHDQASVYYRGGTILVSLATVGLITSLEANHRAKDLLSLRPLVAIGAVSYGLYLWHWPVYRVVELDLGSTSVPRNAAVAIVATAVISVASYRLVEQPIRHGSLFSRISSKQVVIVGLTATVATSAAFMAVLPRTNGPDWARQAAAPDVLEPAVASDSSRLESDRTSSAEVEGLRIGVVGDSVMVSLLPGLRRESAAQGFELIEAAVPACPIGYQALFSADGTESPYAAKCNEVVEPAHDALLDREPDLVIWHDLQSVLPRRAESGRLLLTGEDDWQAEVIEEWNRVLDRFAQGGARIAIVKPFQRGHDEVGACDESANPARCQTIQDQDLAIRAATLAWWEQLPRNASHIIRVDLDDVVCVGGPPCPTTVEEGMLRESGSDMTHFTPDGSNEVARELLRRALDR